jgi:hypothetical protein
LIFIDDKLFGHWISPIAKRNTPGDAFSLQLVSRSHVGHSLTSQVKLKLTRSRNDVGHQPTSGCVAVAWIVNDC